MSNVYAYIDNDSTSHSRKQPTQLQLRVINQK